MIIGYIGGSTNYLLWYDILFPPIGHILITFYMLTITYAILRHQFLNIKIVLVRRFIALIVYLLLVVFLFVMLLIVQKTASIIIAESPFWTLLTIIAITVAIAAPMKRLIYWLISGVIKKEYIDLYQWTDEERELLSKTDNPEKIGRCITHSIMKRVPVETVRLIAYDHLARCYTSAFPNDQKKIHDISELWIQTITQKSELIERVRIATDFPKKEAAELLKQCEFYSAEYMMPLFAYKRLVGILFVGSRVDKKAFTRPQHQFIGSLQQPYAEMLWRVLQTDFFVKENLEKRRMVGLTVHKKNRG